MAGGNMTDDDKPGEKESLLEKAKRCLKLVVEAESSQRERERDDIRFQIGDNQWSEEAKKDRQGRPTLSVSLLHQPMQIVRNQSQAARLGVDIQPVSETASKENAEVKQDLYRRVERDGDAEAARSWALDHAVQAGRGWYRINTQFDEESENPSDQEIIFERILYQQNVYMDPASQKADYSDAKWAIVAAWMRPDDFRAQYPDAKYGSDGDFKGLVETAPEWVRDGKDGNEGLVVEYFYKIITVEDAKLDAASGPYSRKRELVTLYRAVMTGAEVLEDGEFIVPLIPIVPVIGRELQPVNGERRWEGMVRPARQAQEFFNYSISNVVERMSLEPKAPYVGYMEQFEGYQHFWDNANRKNFPYLPVNMLTADGKVIPLPQRSQIDQTGTSLAMMGMELAKSLVQSATAIYDPSLGDSSKSQQESGRKVLALQQQADASTSNYTQSLADALKYEAKVVLAMMPKVYDRPGRIITVLGGEDEERTIMLGKPYTVEDGKPVPAQPGAQNVKEHNLSDGKYSIAVTIGKSYQTRLQQGKEELGELLPNLPPEIQVIALPNYMRFRDTPGAQELADDLKKFRDAKFPMLAQGEEGETPSAEQLQAQIQSMQQQGQMMQQQLQLAIKAIETDQAKQQAMLQKAQMDLQGKQMELASEERIAAANNETKMAIEGMNVKLEAMLAMQKQSHDEALKHEEMAHEVALEAAKGRSMTVDRERGEETGRESSEEMGRESGSERGNEANNEPEETGAEA